MNEGLSQEWRVRAKKEREGRDFPKEDRKHMSGH